MSQLVLGANAVQVTAAAARPISKDMRLGEDDAYPTGPRHSWFGETVSTTVLDYGGEEIELLRRHKSGLLMVNISQFRDLCDGHEIPEPSGLQAHLASVSRRSDGPKGETLRSRRSSRLVDWQRLRKVSHHSSHGHGELAHRLDDNVQTLLKGRQTRRAPQRRGRQGAQVRSLQ